MGARRAVLLAAILVAAPPALELPMPAGSDGSAARADSGLSEPQGEGAASSRDWNVVSVEERRDERITLDGNLTVGAGGRLILDNVTLLFNCSHPGQYGLEVRAGGELSVANSSLDSAGAQRYGFRALASSRVTLLNSTVSGAGFCATSPELAGPALETSNAVLQGTTFTRCLTGLSLLGAYPGIYDCRFVGNSFGLLAVGSSLELRRCTFESNTDAGVLLANSSTVTALDCTLNLSDVKVLDEFSALELAWPLELRVVWGNMSPVRGAIVRVTPRDGPERIFQADEGGLVSVDRVISHTALWNGTVYHGPFNLSAEAEGHRCWVAHDILGPENLTLVIDATPPLLGIEFPADGAELNSSTITIRGWARDTLERDGDAGIALVEVSLDGGAWAEAEGRSEWSLRLERLSEGRHSASVRAWDMWENPALSGVSFVVDTTPPALEVWPPPGHLTASTSVAVRILSDGAVVLFNGIPQEGFSPGLPIELNWSLEEGENRAVVESIDRAGNEASEQLVVFRDTLPPEISILSPAPFSELSTQYVDVRGTCADAHGVELVEVSVDRLNWTRCKGNESWSASVLVREGVVTVHIRARDSLGNVGLSAVLIFVRLPDRAPPLIEVLSPLNGSEVALAELSVQGRASDPGGVSVVELSIDGVEWVRAEGLEVWRCTIELSPGWNIVRVRAADPAGNTGTVELWVRYSPAPPDTSPPLLEIVHPRPGLRVRERGIVISGLASDPSGLNSVEVSVGGKEWRRCVIVGQEWSGTVSLHPGNNTILVRAFDSSGNRATAVTYVLLESGGGAGASPAALGGLVLAVAMTAAGLWIAARAYSGAGGGGANGRAGLEERGEGVPGPGEPAPGEERQKAPGRRPR
ncbi:MAG: Ig-like domain-containing protein [Thermoplasmatota archaeon]